MICILTQNQIDNSIGSIIGGLFLAIIFFTLKEYIFRLPNLNGHWELNTTINKTSYNTYKGLELKYHVVLFRLDNKIKGTGEKIEEIKIDKSVQKYVGDKRTTILIEGSLARRYFSRSQITMHIIEEGRSRESSSIHELKLYKNPTLLSGTFFSTAADSSGTSSWRKA